MVADAGGAAHAVDPETLPEPEQGRFPKWKADPDAAIMAVPGATPSVLRCPGTEQDVGVQQKQRQSKKQDQKMQKQMDKRMLQAAQGQERKQSWQPQWQQQWGRRPGPDVPPRRKKGTASGGAEGITISAGSPFTGRKWRIQGSGANGNPTPGRRKWYRSGDSGTSGGDTCAAFLGGCLSREYCPA